MGWRHDELKGRAGLRDVLRNPRAGTSKFKYLAQVQPHHGYLIRQDAKPGLCLLAEILVSSFISFHFKY